MIRRKIYQQLLAWKSSVRRKPLILKGARQVGKTYILEHFGRQEYEDVFLLNFDEMPEAAAFFDADLSPSRILKELGIYFKKKIEPGKHLIFFDEIQECPNALSALKYFCEKKPEYHIVAAGSLLGVRLSKGFPVGKVNFLKLYPLSFFEFLEAMGESGLCELLNDKSSMEPLTGIFHQQLLGWLKYYYVIGGMPEAVASYREHNDMHMLSEIHNEILDAYIIDFAKHAPKKDLAKIMSVWQMVPSQLAKENKKFIFTAISKSARATHYEDAVQWLVDAGLIYKAFNISKPGLPLDAYANKNIYKVYMLDVGLLGAMSKLDPATLLKGSDLFNEFKGALTENYVAQELVCLSGEPLYYWSSNGTAEVDFITSWRQHIYPLEVKAGISTRKKSLLVYGEKYQGSEYATSVLSRSTLRNFALDGNIASYPLYAVSLFPSLAKN